MFFASTCENNMYSLVGFRGRIYKVSPFRFVVVGNVFIYLRVIQLLLIVCKLNGAQDDRVAFVL